MTIKIPKQNWTAFLEDLGIRRFEWRTRIEVRGSKIGDHLVNRGMPLMGISARESGTDFVIRISYGGNAHFSHTITNPVSVAYLGKQGKAGGIVEFEEIDGTRTRVHIDEPAVLIEGMAEGTNSAALAVV